MHTIEKNGTTWRVLFDSGNGIRVLFDRLDIVSAVEIVALLNGGPDTDGVTGTLYRTMEENWNGGGY